MQDLFLKSVRWLIVVLFVIGGIGLLHFGDQLDSIKPVLPGLVSLGIAYILGTAWKDLRRKLLFITLVLVVGLAYSAQFVDTGIYILTGKLYDINYFVAWAGLCLIPGFPVMMFMFYKYGD